MLVEQGVALLVGCMSTQEMEWAGVADIAARCQERGIRYEHSPMLDQSVPELDEMGRLTALIGEALSRGDVVVAHCMGGLGRSGTTAACLLTREGEPWERAIEIVRDARGPRAVESAVQEAFVERFVMR